MQFRTCERLLRQVLKKAGVKEDPRHFISVLALVAFRMPSSRHFSTIDCQLFRPWQWRSVSLLSRKNAFQALSTCLKCTLSSAPEVARKTFSSSMWSLALRAWKSWQRRLATWQCCVACCCRTIQHTHLWTEAQLRFQVFTPFSLASIRLYDPFCWSSIYVIIFKCFKHVAESPKAEKLLDWPLIWSSGLRDLRPLQAPGVRILTCALDSHLNEAGGVQLARTGFRACPLSPNVMLNNNR